MKKIVGCFTMFLFVVGFGSAQSVIEEFEPKFLIVSELASKIIPTEGYLILHSKTDNTMYVVSRAGNNDATRSLLRSLLNGTPEQIKETVGKIRNLTAFIAQPFPLSSGVVFAVTDTVKVSDIIDSCDVFGLIGFHEGRKLNEQSSLFPSIMQVFNKAPLARFKQLKLM